MDVLLKIPIAVKRHHDQSNCCKGQYLIGAGIQTQRFRPLSSRLEHSSTQACMAWHGMEGTESSASLAQSSQEQTVFEVVRRRVSKSIPTVTYFLQHSHTYSNKPTPPNTATPYGLMGATFIQTTTGLFNPQMELW